VVWWKEDEYRATKIYVNLETDEVSMEGDVQAQVKYKSEEDSAEKGPAGQGPAGQGPGEVKSE